LYASLLGISGALPLDVFDQPAKHLFFSDLGIAEKEISSGKMKKIVLLMLAMIAFWLPSLSWARAGGGCFLPESQVLKADGTEMPISSAKPGDQVLAFTTEGRLVRTQIRDVVRTEVSQYVILQTDRVTLRVTEDHPFYVGRGTLKTLEALKPGDAIMAWFGTTRSIAWKIWR
jgi:hypothetical protein